MSTFDTLFWHVLGYSVMAMVFIVGFGITAAILCFLLERYRGGERHDD
jgi:uncharacterized protein (TIGR02808 family)